MKAIIMVAYIIGLYLIFFGRSTYRAITGKQKIKDEDIPKAKDIDF